MKLQLLLVLCLFDIYAECKWRPSYDVAEHQRYEKHQKRSREYHRKFESNEISTQTNERFESDPPDPNNLIAMARYVMHNTIWCSISTISTLPAIEGFPFTNVKSIVDGSVSNSTGVPYFYMAPADFTAKDLLKNSRASVLVSLEETGYCSKQNYDPQDPRCTRLMLTGKMKKVKDHTSEYTFAQNALFERHPDMKNYPIGHQFFVAKLKIIQIAMVDWFGGAKYIPVRDYLAYNYTGTDTLYKKHN